MPNKRGRPSAESLSIVPFAFPQRPEPPTELSPEQAEIWRAYVDDMPADWFTPKTFPDLANLCGLVTESRLLRGRLRDFASGIVPEDETRRRRIRKDYESVALTITTLETKLRLTHQSKNDPDRADKARTAIANAASGRKPWD
jgi:hypothetical protein